MHKREIKIEFLEYESSENLPDVEKDLLKQAKNAASKAYAPYSHFHVGSAVLLKNGKIFLGNNQENAAYPSGLCAERVALFSASARYPGVDILAIAITATSKETSINEPITPCGACRQVMIEYENMAKGNIKIIMSGERGKVLVSETVKNLIPLSFDGNHLIKK
ncbi:MAG: cytidine deaminase [Bacteroidetes bacterium CG2_30_33_31]|nr:MAG: cytidine deaminase [Bacteroidetes bacterium CG2_30_33_31]